MKVVVVGHGMAGARLAGELRARTADVKITVLGAEPHGAYNRILLSGVVAGKLAEPDVALTAAHGLDVRPGVVVEAIDRAARTVRTDKGDIIGYDHLVLATGSRAVVPPVRGLGSPLPDRVATFRTLDDCRRILDLATGARTAVVLGGGLLGLEAARGLAARGISVQIVHAVRHLMERQLDPGAGAVLVRTLASLGISAYLDAAAVAVRPAPSEVELELADGRTLAADLLVVACGVRPETRLAEAAGLAVAHGIVVDDRLRTSDRHISAIGDCAQHRGVVGGLVAPAWEQARVLARLLAGDDPLAHYRPLQTVFRLKAAGIDLATMGFAGASDPGHEELCFADPAGGTYAKVVLDGDRLVGAIMLGDNPAVGTVIQLFDRGAPVPADRRALLLGRSTGVVAATPAQTPALMPDAAVVCQCNTVTKGTLVRCWRSGARSVADAVAATNATTGCGTCHEAVEGIVDWLSTVEG